MKPEELLLLAFAGIAVFMVARMARTGAASSGNGWEEASGGVRIDPQGNWWKGNQMVWRAPGLMDTGGRETAIEGGELWA